MKNPGDVLTDELVPVRREKEGVWRIYSSPFWGGGRPGGTSLQGWPLAAVAFLKQDRVVSSSRLEPATAVQQLLGTTLSFEFDAEAVRRHLSLATAVVSEVPALEIRSALRTSGPEIFDALALPERNGLPSSTARESISHIRSILRRGNPYAFISTGVSMRPAVRSGDVLLVEPWSPDSATSGDVVLYWRPGEEPDRDMLICHRLVSVTRTSSGLKIRTKGDNSRGTEAFIHGEGGEVLGKVVAITRAGRAAGPRGRLEGKARLAGSLAKAPLLALWRG
jgi:signal peptidase I